MSVVLQQIKLGCEFGDTYYLKTDSGKDVEVKDYNSNGLFDNNSETQNPDVIQGLNGEELSLTDEERNDVIKIINEYDVVSQAQTFARNIRESSYQPNVTVDAYYKCKERPTGPYKQIESGYMQSRKVRFLGMSHSFFSVDDFDEDNQVDHVQFLVNDVRVSVEKGANMMSQTNARSGFTGSFTKCWVPHENPSQQTLDVLSAFNFVFEQ